MTSLFDSCDALFLFLSAEAGSYVREIIIKRFRDGIGSILNFAIFTTSLVILVVLDLREDYCSFAIVYESRADIFQSTICGI